MIVSLGTGLATLGGWTDL